MKTFHPTPIPHIYIDGYGKLYFADSTRRDIFFYELLPDIHKVNTVQSDYQLIQILQTINFGKALAIDGTIQCAEKDEFLYHEPFVHPAMSLHTNPRSVYILGGGDGATLREVTKNPFVQEVIMVDIDREVISITQKEMPFLWNHSQVDRRITIINDDALVILAQMAMAGKKFDIVYFDLTDPKEGTSDPIYTSHGLSLIKQCLTDHGFLVTQCDEVSEAHHSLYQLRLWNLISEVFGKEKNKVFVYDNYIPSFACKRSFMIASNEYFSPYIGYPAIQRYIETLNTPTAFYSPETHYALFALSPTLQKIYGVV